MGKTEIVIFIILASIILLIFITGIVIFVFQFRKRRILYETEKATIEEQHKLDLLNTQVDSQQQTMQFIGREIHDSVAQKLTLASIYTQKMEFENQYPGMFHKLNDISRIINDSLAELRLLSKNLTDSKLQNATFEDLLLQECEQVNATGVCTATAVSSIGAGISIAVKSQLLRIVQEFLQNSLKHSGCKKIGIAVKDSPEGLSLEMQDDGKGFDMDAVQSGGIGLNNMKRRIQMVGGEYTLTSVQGRGTRLGLFIPLSQLNT